MNEMMTLSKTAIFNNALNTYLENVGSSVIQFAVNFVIALLIVVIGFKCIKYVVGFCQRVFVRANMDPTLQTFLISAIKIGLKVLFVFWAITKMGVAASSVIALLGSGAIALGLAIQGSLTNIAGGVVLLFMKPFKIGDWIVEGGSGKEGTVEGIGIMYTKIVTKDNRMIMIPNGSLASSTITNVSSKETRLEDIIVGIEYSESIKKVREVLNQVLDKEEAILRDQEIEVFVNEFKDSCIDMRIRFWVNSSDYWPCKWRMLENIKEAFDANGISIPFNQLDVNLKKED